MKKGTGSQQSGFSALEGLLAVLVIGVLAGVSVVVYQHNRPQATGATGGTQTTKQGGGKQTTTTQPTVEVAYTSSKEHASFQYPSNWTVAKYSIGSSDANNTDHVGLVSPSGAITISYVTNVTGFGNEHTASYPYNVVIDKAAITDAPGLYVVSGITTLDSTTYYPWLAVQGDDGIVTTGVKGDVMTFASRHALNPTTNDLTRILFATCGLRASQNSPALTKDQATAWLSGTEAQQAKQILLSFTDAQ